MRIVGITMVRNEEDILEPFVRHHVAVLDRIVVIDHASLDRTPDILAELAREGLPLLTRREESGIQHQWQLLTAAMREASRDLEADWILPLDVDEFLVPPDRSGLEDALSAIPMGSPARLYLRGYIPTPSDNAEALNPLERITHRRREEHTTWWKVVVPALLAADERLSLEQGNHALQSSDGPLDAVPLQGFNLAHFPLRSSEQASRKILAGWLAHLARADRERDLAFQWRRLFNELAGGKELSPSDLERAAIAYSLHDPAADPSPALVEDPVPVGYAVRYTNGLTRTPLEILARTAAALVEELGSANGSEAPE